MKGNKTMMLDGHIYKESWDIEAGMTTELNEIFKKAEDFTPLTKEEGLRLIQVPLHSDDCYRMMAVANHMSREQFGNKGENHLHVGLNVEPCPLDCLFCSLTHKAGIFTEKKDFPEEQILAWAREAEKQGCDGINLMTTGTYPFSKLLEMGRMVSWEVSVPLIANTRDISHAEGEELLKAGFTGFYHAVRLGEGRDTPLNREKRIDTVKVLRDVGLLWMNCIEPVGPEHSDEEIIELMFLARDYDATYSGVMRRINFPGSPMSKYGMITELEMARLVAVSRLIMGNVPKAHCTHEPHSASLMAGANLFFPEVGSSPRDRKEDTGKGRGICFESCRRIQEEMNLDPSLPSNCYQEIAR
jgi:biotin synthase